jgi:hypothetical protein
MSVWLGAENDSDSKPLSLLRPAFQKMDLPKGTRTRFTFLDLHHNVNFNEKGKKTADETQLYDVTYIGDLQCAARRGLRARVDCSLRTVRGWFGGLGCQWTSGELWALSFGVRYSGVSAYGE